MSDVALTISILRKFGRGGPATCDSRPRAHWTLIACGDPCRRATLFDTLRTTAPTNAAGIAAAAVGPDTVAKLLFTSGTTGLPARSRAAVLLECPEGLRGTDSVAAPRSRAAGELLQPRPGAAIFRREHRSKCLRCFRRPCPQHDRPSDPMGGAPGLDGGRPDRSARAFGGRVSRVRRPARRPASR
jgi:hypothetical protein